MSAKPVNEYAGKRILFELVPELGHPMALVQISANQSTESLLEKTGREQSAWISTTPLVVKPDQLIKRRGKLGLIGVNRDWNGVQTWIQERASKEIVVTDPHQSESLGIRGILNRFLIEPFIPHTDEYYLCITSTRDGDEILFCEEGGVDVGDVDAKATRLLIPTYLPETVTKLSKEEEEKQLRLYLDKQNFSQLFQASKTGKPSKLAADQETQQLLTGLLKQLMLAYWLAHFTYLEINPLVVAQDATTGKKRCYVLDLAAKIDQTGIYEAGRLWSWKEPGTQITQELEFPAPFGRVLSKEEQYIQELDSKTGASLKLTILNERGRIWTMVAGGGASVVYSDAIAGNGFAHELANYGEYSGAPSEAQTFEYAQTILELMTRHKLPEYPPNGKIGDGKTVQGKVLLIGGGIANFTNVAATFKGIVRALRKFAHALREHHVRIFVRRGGPNWQEGLRQMRAVGEELQLDMYVYGPDSHITAIVPMALGLCEIPDEGAVAGNRSTFSLLGGSHANASRTSSVGKRPNGSTNSSPQMKTKDVPVATVQEAPKQTAESPNEIQMFPSTPVSAHPWYQPFTTETRSFIYGMQPRAVQGMLDFDRLCGRSVPSVAGMIYPFGGSHVQKFYWGDKETLLPVFKSISEAVTRFPEVDTVINFASSRSVYESTEQLLEFGQFRTIAIIAEGVPERRSRQLLKRAKQKNVLIIGPATVGGIKPGCFKIGNTGGMIDNIIASKLYRAGSVSYVSKSGGMSNELNHLISMCTDGVYEGVAIGGDRYPGSTFIDHLLRFEADPNCKILLLLGEVGGVEEYVVAEALRTKKITKPLIAWCIGTCASMFGAEVQFGHAGACASSNAETALAKNQALRNAGALVPDTFETLPDLLTTLYEQLCANGQLIPKPDTEPPKIPIDYAWAQELGLIRKPASFISTICDDRGQELLYAGVPISRVFEDEIGIGGVLSLLWFKRRLPEYACEFIEMILMLTADHGPAVSGAHNTIVTARAGKDLISSLCSGLLTIGDRFGGALDGAAEQFSMAYDKGWTPQEFVDTTRKANQLILGIGHKIKSKTNPDLRVRILVDFAHERFPATPLLDYALQVEDITTKKKDNLILNVDGAVGVLFVDLLRHSGAFTPEEAAEYIQIGTLNGLFVLGRSIGFIGHYLDQKRLKQGLYRHPWDDISYLVGEGAGGGENVNGQ